MIAYALGVSLGLAVGVFVGFRITTWVIISNVVELYGEASAKKLGLYMKDSWKRRQKEKAAAAAKEKE